MIKKRIKNFIRNILIEISKEKIIKEKSKCTYGENVVFFETTNIINRQNKLTSINIGNNTVIRGELFVMGYGGKITIGNNCYVGENSRIWSGSDIRIGNNILISHNVNIIDTNSHQINHIERSRAFEDLLKNGYSTVNNNIKSKPIIIEDYAWINFNCTILKGVKIGKGAIIGPDSLILEDVPEFTFYAGSPAKFIKSLV